MQESLEPSSNVYTPIQGRTIRLLSLVPGRNNEPIACELFTVDLESRPSYVAISYVWGHPHEDDDPSEWTQTISITLDRIPFSVRMNLHNCLRDVRLETTSRVLWIDAVCINQRDTEEKSCQIQMMGDIYRSSRQTLVWLGHDREYMPTLDLAQWVSKDCKCGSITAKDRPWPVHLSIAFSFLEQRADDRILGHSMADSIQVNSLIVLMHSTWWTRVWVVQEILLSPVALLVLGKCQLPWRTLLLGVNNIKSLATSSSWKLWSSCAQLVNTYSPLMGNEDEEYHHRTALKQIASENKHQMLSYLWMVRNKQATLRHDKVYAIFGLLANQPNVTPDYKVPWMVLYCLVTREIIRTTGRLDVLQGITPNDPSDDVLPSWVHDWNKQYDDGVVDKVMKELSHPMFAAAGSRKAVVADLGLGDTLGITGFVVDIIDCKTNWWSLNPVINPPSKKRLKASLKNIKSTSENTKEYITGGSHFAAFWRTSVSDYISATDPGHNDIRRTKPCDGIVWMLWWRSVRKNPAIPWSQRDVPAVYAIQSSFDRATRGRQFFSTSKGFMGSGPFRLKQGDLVVILFGGGMPFVLRPSYQMIDEPAKASPVRYAINNQGSESLTYRLIGECYLHGVMDGELINDGGSPNKEEIFYLV